MREENFSYARNRTYGGQGPKSGTVFLWAVCVVLVAGVFLLYQNYGDEIGLHNVARPISTPASAAF